MRKVLIIEDDHFSAKRLEKLISNIDNSIEIDGPLKSVTEVVDKLTENNDYDLIFSDIRLVDGDVFEAFRKIMPKSLVVFTTAYDDYAMSAIKNNGLDYLMKPIDAEELRGTFDKLAYFKEQNNTSGLEEAVNEIRSYRERFLVGKGDELKVLAVNDINYICKDGNATNAFTDEGGPYPIQSSMSDLESELDPNTFFRINRQYIANINSILRINLLLGSKLKVHLKGCADDDIIVSKDKTASFKKWLDR